MIQRDQLVKLEERIKEPRRFIQILSGPRQVGKTTMVHQLLNRLDIPTHFATADAVLSDSHEWLHQQWRFIRAKIESQVATEGLLVIDEIQKIPNWSEIVKAEWELDSLHQRQVKVVLLGSAQLLILKGLTESLAGRFEMLPIYHWTYAEMQKAFDLTLDDYIWYGGYPGAMMLRHDEERWKLYIQTGLMDTTISRDVLMLNRIDKPALLRMAFETGCAFSAQILSYTKMIGQLQDAGNTVTIANYLRLLDEAGLLAGLEKFSPDIQRQRGSIPKLQVYNTALLSTVARYDKAFAQSHPEIWGRHVESTIGAYIMNQARIHSFRVWYWRERNDEVDFVLQRFQSVVAIEVKSGGKSTVKGLKAFKDRYSPHQLLTVGTGGLSLEEFLNLNLRDLF